jgi:hypothetical protein
MVFLPALLCGRHPAHFNLFTILYQTTAGSDCFESLKRLMAVMAIADGAAGRRAEEVFLAGVA